MEQQQLKPKKKKTKKKIHSDDSNLETIDSNLDTFDSLEVEIAPLDFSALTPATTITATSKSLYPSTTSEYIANYPLEIASQNLTFIPTVAATPPNITLKPASLSSLKQIFSIELSASELNKQISMPFLSEMQNLALSGGNNGESGQEKDGFYLLILEYHTILNFELKNVKISLDILSKNDIQVEIANMWNLKKVISIASVIPFLFFRNQRR
jgi:hypothetical protein